MLWLGREWIEKAVVGIPERGLIVDMSLIAVLTRLGFASWMIGLAWITVLVVTLYVSLTGQPTMGREKAGMLIAASLSLAPYSVGNSFLTVLAIGIIPLFQKQQWLGLLLIVLTDLPLLFPTQIAYNWGANYIELLLLITWGIFCFRLKNNSVEKQSTISYKQLTIL
jgi:hypothetical protein